MNTTQGSDRAQLSSTSELQDLERELAAAKEQFGEYHYTTIAISLKLAALLKESGNSANALDLCVTARNFAKDAFYAGHHLELEALCLISDIYREQGHHDIADEIKSRVLQMLQSRELQSQKEIDLAIKLSAESTEVGASKHFFESLLKNISLEKIPIASQELLLAKMGNLHHTAKDFEKAKDFYNSLFYLEETKIAPHSIDVVNALVHLAEIKLEEQDYLDGREVLKKALRKAQALEAPLLELQILSRLIDVSISLEKNADALKLANQYSKVCEKVFGSESEEYALALVSMGNYACELAQFQEACSYLEQAVAKLQRLENPSHLIIAEQYHNLAVVYFAVSQAEEALKNIQLAIEFRRTTLGEHHEDTLISSLLFAKILVSEKETQKAQEILSSLLPAIASTLGKQSVEYLDAQKLLREASQQNVELSSAMEGTGQEHALPQSDQDYSLNSIDFQQAVTLFNQATVLSGSGDYSQAFRLLKQVLPVFEAALGSQHMELLPVLQQLEGVAYATGNTLQAQECYRRIQAIKKADATS